MKSLIIFILLAFSLVSCAIFLPYDTVEGLEIRVEPLNNLVSSSQPECIVVVKYKNMGNKAVKLAEHIRGYPEYFWDKYTMQLTIKKDAVLKNGHQWTPNGRPSMFNYPHKILKPNQLVIDTLKVDFGRILDVDLKDSLAWLRKNEDYGTYRFKFTYTPHKNYFKKSSKQVESNWAEVVYKK